MKLVGLVVSVVAGCCLLSGCGSSGSPSAVGATVRATLPITKAQAVEYAHAVNLRVDDLPGMRVTKPEGEGNAPGRQDRELATCDGGPNPERLIAKIHSATFTGATEGEDEEIKSNVEVEPTEALAAKSDAVALSQRFLRCLVRLLPGTFEKATGRAHYGRATVSRLPTPLPGVEGSFGVEITTTVTSAARVGQPPIPVYIDEFGFVSGPVEVSLASFGAPQPVPTEASERLLALLHSRAEAHKL